jgi:hypothetical protein
VAPVRNKGRGVLLNMLSQVVKVSCVEREAFRRTAAPVGAVLCHLREPQPGWRCVLSAAAVILPFVWAFSREQAVPEVPVQVLRRPVEPQMAFYRKYTEAMLRRYVRLSIEAGKVPSLLGQEMFRGKVTSCRVGNFDDVVIFVHDVERCLEKLDEEQQHLISRIALQQYNLGETAELMGLKPRTVVRRYGQAVDRLTRVFLSVKMLNPLKCCQGGE